MGQVRDDVILVQSPEYFSFVVFLKLGLLVFKPEQEWQILIRKQKMKWILVVAVKRRHRENGLLKDVKIRPPLTYIIWRSFRCCFPCRSNESKAYPLILGDDVFDIYCNMAVAPTENDACGVGGWTLVMKINGTKVYLFQHSPFRLLNQETDETMDFFLFVSNRYIYDENSKNTTFYCFIARYIVIWLEIFSQLVTSTSHDI